MHFKFIATICVQSILDIYCNKCYSYVYMNIIFLFCILILVILIFSFLSFNWVAFLCCCLSLLVLVAFCIVFKKRITKRIITCFLLIVIFQVLFIVFIYQVGRKKTLVARTDNINQANKIQNVLLDNYFSSSLSKDGIVYEVFCTCKKNEIDNIMAALSENDAVNQNVSLELFDKGDFTTTKENKRNKLMETINNRLTIIIKNFDEVENVNVSVSIPESSFFAYAHQPITANIYLETATGDVHKHRRIEKSIKNLLISSINGLMEENLKIKIKVVK